MITSAIGKQFIKFYNKKMGTEYNSSDFFKEIFLPLFFDHPKYMMTGGNSPLENPKISWKKNKFPSPEERAERISKTLDRIENDYPDASIAVGYSAIGDTAATASQVTDLNFNFTPEDTYSSWIGSALSIGVKGGYLILFMEDEILWKVYEGWEHYRKLLNAPENMNLKGLQIQTWNGVWIDYTQFEEIDKENVLYDIINRGYTSAKENHIAFDTIPWAKVFLSISNKYRSKLSIYVYNVGQMNTTIGFIQCDLDEIHRPIDFYKKIFGVTPSIKFRSRIHSLLGGETAFRIVCLSGQIGVKTMEPKGLKQYLSAGSNIKSLVKQSRDQEQVITYQTYISWIIAMLNNQEVWDKAGMFATNLVEYTLNDPKKVSRIRENDITAILESVNKKQFIESLTKIVKSGGEVKDILSLGEFINNMAPDDIVYFLALIRFRYYEKISKKGEGNE